MTRTCVCITPARVSRTGGGPPGDETERRRRVCPVIHTVGRVAFNPTTSATILLRILYYYLRSIVVVVKGVSNRDYYLSCPGGDQS